MIYVQRSALGEGGESLNVELQANTYIVKYLWEKKNTDLFNKRMTYDLHTFCNGSDMEMTMLYRVAFIKKIWDRLYYYTY